MAINKVVYGADTLLDLTEDTVTEDKVLKGETFHDRSGVSRTGNVNVPVPEDITVVDEFISYNGGRVKSVQMELSPIQDLHGYDSPWVGGAGKNKCPLTVDGIKSANTTVTWNGNSCVFNGVTITILTDTNNNVIGLKFLGTASSYFYFNVNSNFTIDGTYIISPLPQGAAYSSAFYGRLYYTDGTDIGFLSSEVTVTKQNAVGRMQIVVSTNATVDFTYQPMLRLSTESDPTFEPYENKCPISGHTQAKLEQRGKNKFDILSYSILDPYVTVSDGNISVNGSGSYRVARYNSLYLAQGTYTLSFKSAIVSGTEFIAVLKSDDTFIFSDNAVTITNYSRTFVIPENGTYKFAIGSATGDSPNITFSDIQIELGSSATDYEPYQGKDYIINLGGTYYWLRGDVVTGKWYVVGKGKDMTTITDWNVNTSDQRIYKILSDIKPTSSGAEIANIISNGFKAISVNDIYAHVQGVAVSKGSALQFHIKGLTDRNDVTLAEVNQWFVDNPTLVVYELATPIPLDLTPQQILAIIGENHFSAPLEQQEIIEIIARNIAEFNEVIDDENVSEDFTYSSEKIEDRLDEYVDKDAVEEKSATTEFTTVNGGLLSECKVTLTPVQDLHGYSKPWVGGAGKNKLNPDKIVQGSLTSPSSTSRCSTRDDISIPISIGQTVTISRQNGNIRYALAISWSQTYYDSGWKTGTSFTYTSEYDGYVALGFSYSDNSDITPSDVISANFMVEFSSTATAYESYENICPISGHTQSKVQNHQKNLLPNIIEQRSTHSFWVGQNSGSTYPFHFEKDKSYAITFTSNYSTSSMYYAEDGGQDTEIGVSGTIFTPTKDMDVDLWIYGGGLSEVSNVQIELGSTATAYVPYNGYQITVNLGGTYYSGTLDVVSGVFTPDTASVDLGTLTWSLTAQGYMNGTGIGSLVKKPASSTDVANIICSALKTVSAFNIYSGGEGIGIHISGEVRVRYDGMSTDVPTFTSAMSGVQLVYELDTPTSIQLSPTMVKALVGENHLSAPLEGQEITESKYRELFTLDEVEEIAQKIADSKIDNHNTSYNTTFSSAFTEARYVKKVYEAPALTALYVVLSGATSVTFNHQLIFSDAQTCCELIQFGSGARIGITDVAISQGSVTFTFDSPLTKAIGFRCRITNDFVS